MELKATYYAPCKGCAHKFTSEGEPKGAPPAGKPKGDPVVLLTCQECGTTQEIPVKAWKIAGTEAPKAAEAPKQTKPEATSTGSGDDTGAGGAGTTTEQQ